MSLPTVLGKGRHLPYTNRGRKKLAIVTIIKKIREKKVVLAGLFVYATILVLDWYSNTLFGLGQDGVIDAFGTHIPYLIIPLQVKGYALFGWIRVKKKDGTKLNIDLKEVDQIDMKATLKQLKRNEHHHKKESNR